METKMDFVKLFDMQRELDEKVESNHPRHEGEDRFIKKTLAAVVEMSETLEDTKIFKFWSFKAPAKRDKVLEELIDVLHFTISLGIEKGVDPATVAIHNIKDKDVNEIARDTIFCILSNSYGFNMFNDIYSHLMKFAEKLDFTDEELMDAYMKKNEVNHDRQAENY